MSGRNFTYSTLAILIWIYAVFAAPAPEEEHMMDKNTTGSCFKDILPEELQLHYDMCLGNNIGGNNIIKESEILSCVLKTAEVISEEEVIDTSKLKVQATEEDSDMKMIEEDNPFIMSVEKCEADENATKAKDFVHCLYDALSMNCTAVMTSNEETEEEKAVEEN